MLQKPGSGGGSAAYSSRRKAVVESPDDIVKKRSRLPANKKCCDCSSKLPNNVNLSVGAFLCLPCAGIHRELPSAPRIKGVGHSVFTTEEAEFLSGIDNDQINAVYLAGYNPSAERLRMPTDNTDPHLLRAWIHRKYKDKSWLRGDGGGSAVPASNSANPSGRAAGRGVAGTMRQPTVVSHIPPKTTVAAVAVVDLFDTGPMPSSSNASAVSSGVGQPTPANGWDAFGSAGNPEAAAFSADFGSFQQQQQQQPQQTSKFANFDGTSTPQPQPQNDFASFPADFGSSQLQQPQHGDVFGGHQQPKEQPSLPHQCANDAPSHQLPPPPPQDSFANLTPQFNSPPQMSLTLPHGQVPPNTVASDIFRQQQPLQTPHIISNTLHTGPQATVTENFGNFQQQQQQQHQPQLERPPATLHQNQQMPLQSNGPSVYQQQQQSFADFSQPDVSASQFQQPQQQTQGFANFSQSSPLAAPAIAQEPQTATVAEDKFDAFNDLSISSPPTPAVTSTPPVPFSFDQNMDTKEVSVAAPLAKDATAPVNGRKSTYSAGQKVYYKSANYSGSAEILKVHFDDELEPFYTIKVQDKEKQTDAKHLDKISPLYSSVQNMLDGLSDDQLLKVQKFVLQMVNGNDVVLTSHSTGATPSMGDDFASMLPPPSIDIPVSSQTTGAHPQHSTTSQSDRTPDVLLGGQTLSKNPGLSHGDSTPAAIPLASSGDVVGGIPLASSGGVVGGIPIASSGDTFGGIPIASSGDTFGGIPSPVSDPKPSVTQHAGMPVVLGPAQHQHPVPMHQQGNSPQQFGMMQNQSSSVQNATAQGPPRVFQARQHNDLANNSVSPEPESKSSGSALAESRDFGGIPSPVNVSKPGVLHQIGMPGVPLNQQAYSNQQTPQNQTLPQGIGQYNDHQQQGQFSPELQQQQGQMQYPPQLQQQQGQRQYPPQLHQQQGQMQYPPHIQQGQTSYPNGGIQQQQLQQQQQQQQLHTPPQENIQNSSQGQIPF